MLHGRTLSLTARNLLMPANYAALGRAAWVYERPLPALSRYMLGRGSYPCVVRVRTILGPQDVTLFCSQDAMTVHEIFCRRDYQTPAPPQVVVDVGSNIGVSALYFLTRSPSAYCYLYEPDPRNIDKLSVNLRLFRDRFTLNETAVADKEGALPFSREATGRYGSLNASSSVHSDAATITVQVEHINTALERALSRTGTIDLLKIDSEGSERATIRAIDSRLRARVRHIVIESRDHRVALDGFHAELHCDTLRFSNENLSR
ncbi:MAG TPA: FkbM family methyltransferase [Streptosporangiaceae bacterium]|nr:FkbM family methyltransferase [Streptosporangiaceae bacterium]